MTWVADPVTYGDGSPGSNSYAWEISPNAGGLPTVPNPTFSLTVEATPAAPAASSVLIGVNSASIPVLAIELLVDPFQPLLTASLASSTSMTLPLPIPNDPGFLGVELYLQSVHLDTVLASSDGVRVRFY